MANTFTQEDALLDEELDVIDQRELVLYNDDVNTFDHVIITLMEVCKHELLQAEQCALIVHYTGKCTVKIGRYEKLEPMCTAILDRGINAQIH